MIKEKKQKEKQVREPDFVRAEMVFDDIDFVDFKQYLRQYVKHSDLIKNNENLMTMLDRLHEGFTREFTFESQVMVEEDRDNVFTFMYSENLFDGCVPSLSINYDYNREEISITFIGDTLRHDYLQDIDKDEVKEALNYRGMIK